VIFQLTAKMTNDCLLPKGRTHTRSCWLWS